MTRITGEIAADVVSSVAGAEGIATVAVSSAVVDDAGGLVAFQRMTGAPRFSADFAIAKARSAATFGTETFAHSFVAQAGYFLGRPRRRGHRSRCGGAGGRIRRVEDDQAGTRMNPKRAQRKETPSTSNMSSTVTNRKPAISRYVRTMSV